MIFEKNTFCFLDRHARDRKWEGNDLFIVTWLILPAIICLSQRLSHACLSISVYTAKLRMAHYISYNLLDRICYLDNCRNSRANTCKKFGPGATLGRMCLLVEKPRWGIQLRETEGSIQQTNHSKLTRIEGVGLWWCKRVSALSTFNRSVGDYGGCNGYGELGFDSGEAAWETATTSKEGSRRVNYPIPIRGDSDKKYWCRAFWVLLSEWVQFKTISEEQLEGKSGASSRGNSSSKSVY